MTPTDPYPPETFGDWLRARLAEQNMSQEALAQQLNISQQAVSKWANDTAKPGRLALAHMAKVIFDVPYEELTALVAATQPAYDYEADATAVDKQDHIFDPAKEVRFAPSPGPAKSALAVRLCGADIDRLRRRAEHEGLGVTQLVRAWVLERLNDEEFADSPDYDAELEATADRLTTLLRARRAHSGL